MSCRRSPFALHRGLRTATMRAQITLKAAAPSPCILWPKSKYLGPASTLHCDHCRADLNHGVHRYWHMQFCSSVCMTAYQQRLSPETLAKIRGLDVLPSEYQISGSNLRSRVLAATLAVDSFSNREKPPSARPAVAMSR